MILSKRSTMPVAQATFWAVALAWTAGLSTCPGAVYNLRVVTDASPDYSDMASLIRSATSRWETPEQKCWAMFYWNHIARRQTAPMILHGLALTDPIRQFNDYGYTMCSTVSGINCSIWDAMGFKAKYWDISLHGFLTGADTVRSMEEESRCFNPNALKYRNYFYRQHCKWAGLARGLA
jgi:hypothetical protein